MNTTNPVEIAYQIFRKITGADDKEVSDAEGTDC